MNFKHYEPIHAPSLTERHWPTQILTEAPTWCSVDLRDGNQSLEIPMSIDEKMTFYQKLVSIGFKDIEVGYPASSPSEFRFCRKLIDEHYIPHDVTIQVLTASRDDIMAETFRAIEGSPRVNVNMYVAISDKARHLVFGHSFEEHLAYVTDAARRLANYALRLMEQGTDIGLEFSPEHWSATSMDEAVLLCDAVIGAWVDAGIPRRILALTQTVESVMPHEYADQIEYFLNHTRYRGAFVPSIHVHNDRGTAIAASELAILAGGSRVEGCLFGNGERTGNVDLAVMALNVMAKGIDPKLDLSQLDSVIEIYEHCTGMEVPIRHPYAGELAFTAFSGTHQDAIRKSLKAGDGQKAIWNVPYLPIDPMDIGRSYQPVIRINAQSGKAGLAYVMEQIFGYQIPKPMQRSFAHVVMDTVEATRKEIKPDQVMELFESTYQNLQQPYRLISWHEAMISETQVQASATIEHTINGEIKTLTIEGSGNGLINALTRGFNELIGREINVTMYHQHAIDETVNSRAITYIGVSERDHIAYGAGVSGNFTKASLRALVSAINRLLMLFPVA